MKLGLFIKYFLSQREIFSNFRRELEDKQKIDRLNQAMLQAGFIQGGRFSYPSPAIHIGLAIEMAENFGIEIHIGTCYGDCRAVLPKEKWRYSLNTSVKSGSFGTFLADMNPKDIHEIYAFGSTVQEAVCKCLLNCRTAGVI